MCGLLGIVAAPGQRPGVSPSVVRLMRDRMTARGPDDAGLVAHRNVVFAHRRLSVIDLEHGQQPMWSPDRRYLLIYNGELYNDAEIRRELSLHHAIDFKTTCDTETLLHAMMTWGPEALNRLRGMFTFALYDFVEDRLLLARDPLGIKPLYYAVVGREVVVASQPGAILAHPAMPAEPDLATVSAYLSTIRTTLGRRTLFVGVQTVLPGECVQMRFEGGAPSIQCTEYWSEPTATRTDLTFEDAAALVRHAVIDSVQSHLRSDVPRCLLLSGGIDSAIVATICRDLGASDIMQTWCAADPDDCGEDRRFASMMADHLGARHHETIVDQAAFHRAWIELIAHNGAPLSTPNETAIHAVAQSLKPYATVALSGEGADELFGGYAMPVLCGLDAMRSTQHRGRWPGGEVAHERYLTELQAQYGTASLGSQADHYLRCNSWLPSGLKGCVLTEETWREAQSDRLLREEITAQVARADEESIEPEQRLLRVQRRINLTGLLGRLDTSTMAASVEGRTPFADVRLAELASSLPFEYKFKSPRAADGGWSSAGESLARGGVETKRVLRAAFARDIPMKILQRPKASFPLPFQKWLAPMVDRIADCAAVGPIICPTAFAALRADPAAQWMTLWPLANVALWFEHQWGGGLDAGDSPALAVDVTRSAGALSEIG